MAPTPGVRRVTALVVALALVLTGCGTGRRTGPVELTFWSWVPGIDKSVALWNRTHPGVRVHLDQITAGTDGGYAKEFSAAKAGAGPDVAQVEYWALPAFVLEHALLDLNPYGVRKYQNRFVPWQWQQGEFNGGTYAIPQASGPMALYYRTDLFKKYGLKPPVTWADYAKAAAVIKRKDPAARIGTFPPANSQWFIALAWQAGAHWFGAADKWSVNIDDPATQKVAAYWDDLRKRDLIFTMQDVQTGWYKAVHDGKIVSWVGPQWGDALLKGNAPNTAGKWRVAPMPQWDPKHEAASNWGGSSSAVMRGTEHPREAMEFAVWLNTDKASINDLIEGGYGWPAAANAFKGSALDKADPFFGGQRYNDVFADADKHIDTRWKWSPTMMSLIDNLNAGFTGATTSGGSFQQTVRAAQPIAVRDMRRKGLQVITPGQR